MFYYLYTPKFHFLNTVSLKYDVDYIKDAVSYFEAIPFYFQRIFIMKGCRWVPPTKSTNQYDEVGCCFFLNDGLH